MKAINEDRDADQALCPCDVNCPIGEVLSMIGGRWKMRLLCTLTLEGPLRYNDLKKKTRGITPAVLSSSLKELERDGLILRHPYAGVPVRVEYEATDQGKELWPILHQLIHWSRNEPYTKAEQMESRLVLETAGKGPGSPAC